MKLKKIQIFLILYIAIAIGEFLIKEFFHSRYLTLKPFFDGMLIVVVAACIIYYARIYITAWMRNRKEELANRG
jgi:pilus assembly protein TadC